MDESIRLTKLSKCAGCGAKVGAGVLAELLGGIQTCYDENLIVGFDRSDDASVYRVSDSLAIVQTLDFFPPVDDDPYLYGQIAAVNALSDVYAMGGTPRLALNILCVPETMPDGSVRQILKGGYDKAYEAGVIITGGHSIFDEEPKYGLSVTGFVHPDRVIKNCGAQPGDVLFLTKPLGIGVLMTAEKADLLSDAGRAIKRRLTTTLNRCACECMLRYDVHACTDVTGFGLLGHLCEMAQGSGVSAAIDADAVACIGEALELATLGILPAGMYRNRDFAAPHVDAGSIPLARQDLLYDPQTAGGLLIAVSPSDADALERDLKKEVPDARRIGTITGKREKAVILR